MKIWVNSEQSLLEKIEYKTKTSKTIICGDTAVDNWSNNDKKKFKLDLLTPKENLNSFIEKLNTIKEIIKVKTHSSNNNKTVLQVEGLITDGFEWVVNLKISLDTSLTKEQLSKIKKDKLAVEVENKGYVLTPEMLVVNSFKKALDFTSSIKHKSESGDINKINYKRNLPKEIFNITSIMVSNDLDSEKLKKAKKTIEKISNSKLNIEKFNNLHWLVQYNHDFVIGYFNEMNKWEDTHLPIESEHLFLEKLKKQLELHKELSKKPKELNIIN